MKKLKKRIMIVVGTIAALSPLILSITAYARPMFGCGGFFHKREVPAKLRHLYED